MPLVPVLVLCLSVVAPVARAWAQTGSHAGLAARTLALPSALEARVLPPPGMFARLAGPAPKQPPQVVVREIELKAPTRLKVYTPSSGFLVRAALALAIGTNRGAGAGVAGSFEKVLLYRAGPGRLLVGGAVQIAIGNAVVGALMPTVSYVLDVDERLRPWTQFGLGLHWTPTPIQPAPTAPQASPAPKRDKTNMGPGLTLALGADLDLGPDWFVKGAVSFNLAADGYGMILLGGGMRI